jgi:hypothetical protein
VIDPGHVEVQSGPLLFYLVFSLLFSLLRVPLWKRTGFESQLSIAMEYKLNNISFPLFRFLQYLFFILLPSNGVMSPQLCNVVTIFGSLFIKNFSLFKDSVHMKFAYYYFFSLVLKGVGSGSGTTREVGSGFGLSHSGSTTLPTVTTCLPYLWVSVADPGCLS